MSFGFAIGDIVAVSELSWKLLLGEISGLSNSLKVLQEEIADPNSTLMRAGEDRVRMVNEMVSRVHITLKDLENVAEKYEVLGSGSRRKQMWAKLKWSVNFSSIDGLRSKLIYHDTVMNLLLTSVGNSSLKRIESSTIALENDLKEIKDYIRPSLESQACKVPAAPSVSAVEDGIAGLSLSSAMMKHVEIFQPWCTISVDQWIQSGKWWLIKSQMESRALSGSETAVSVVAYANLIKASWILVDIIACHPQMSFLDSNTCYEVQILSAELKNEFRRISKSNLKIPELCDLEDKHLQIWEFQAKEPLLRPGKQSLGGFWTVSGGEQLLFQRFALYQRPAFPEPLPCIVMLLSHETLNQARLIAQDQDCRTTMEATVRPDMEVHQEGHSLKIYAENIIFTVSKDADLLSTILEAVKFYLFCLSRESVNFDELCALILIFAVKNQSRDNVLYLLDNLTSTSDFPRTDYDESISVVAFSLASEFIRTELKDVSPENFQHDKPRIRLLVWAVKCGHIAVLRFLCARGLVIKETEYNEIMTQGMTMLGLASFYGHEEVVQILLGERADVQEKDSKGHTALYLAAFGEHRAVVKLLLQEGAGIEEDNSVTGDVLTSAVLEGNIKMVELLLAEGANIEAKNKDGRNALHAAVLNEDVVMTELLLQAGADVYARTTEDLTALNIALFSARTGETQNSRLLLAKCQSSFPVPLPRGKLRRAYLWIQSYSNRMVFVLDSPLARIEPTEYTKTGLIDEVQCRAGRLITLRRPITTATFNIAYYENEPLDFSIGGSGYYGEYERAVESLRLLEMPPGVIKYPMYRCFRNVQITKDLPLKITLFNDKIWIESQI